MLDRQQQRRVQQGRSSTALTQPSPRTNWRVLRISWTSLQTQTVGRKKRQVCRKLSTDGQTRILGEAIENGTLKNSPSPVRSESKDAFAEITFLPMRGGDTSSVPASRWNGLLTPRRSSIYFWHVFRCGMLVVSLPIHCSSVFSLQLRLLTACRVFGQLQYHMQVVRRS